MNHIIKKLLLGLSSLSLFGVESSVATEVHVTDQSNRSFDLAASSGSTSVQKITQTLKDAQGQSGDGDVLSEAVREIVSQNPHVSIEAVAASLNRLDLSQDTLQKISLSAANALDVPGSVMRSTLIADAYINSGKDAAFNVAQSLNVPLQETNNDLLQQGDATTLLRERSARVYNG